MKLIHVLILAAVVGLGIIFALSMSDWSPDNLGGFQSGKDPNKRVYHEPEKLGTYADDKPRETAPAPAPESVEKPVEKVVELVIPPKPDDPKFAWQYETLVGDYLRFGKRNPKWDQAAVNALYGLARQFANRDVMASELLPMFRTAASQGCDDPLMNYGLELMDVSINGISSKEKILKLYQIGTTLHHSKYHPFRRCIGLVRGITWLNQLETKMSPATLLKYTVGADLAIRDLEELLKDKTTPINLVYDDCIEIIKIYKFLDIDRMKSFGRLKPLIEKHRPGTSLLPAVAGRFYIDYAWDARGNEIASKVTPIGWKMLAERLAIAKKHLDQAYSMDVEAPNVIPNMISVSMGQSADHNAVNLWFDRGVKAIPDEYDLYSAKLYYLQPRWHGSPEEITAFGRECVERARSPKQKNKEIAFILIDAHELLSDDFKRTGKPVEDYWKQPGVFNDVSLVYETLLGIYPQASVWRAKYAYYACLAEQWKIANAQFQVLGIECPPGPFGGEQKLAVMRTTAIKSAK
jgi:hypothetical protein